ncbi:MAG: metal-dependent phosphohydrolase [Rubritepida sp.]|nr:metal-dependent phosphohydrolase [Rubritepida sp.]
MIPDTIDRDDFDGYEDLLQALPEIARDRTRTAMGRTGTPYHGKEHLGRMWRLHREVFGSDGQPEMALLIAYHDIVYDPRAPRNQNEEHSAGVFLRDQPELGLTQEEAHRITEAILASSDHLGAGMLRVQSSSNPWGAWFLDLDLEPLASPHFDRNTERLREEFGHVPPEQFNAGRKAFLESFLAAPYIFRTAMARTRSWEDKARENISRALGLLA